VVKPEHVTLCSLLPSHAPPPLVVATLNMRTVLHPTNGQNEVVMIGCLVHSGFHVDRAPPQPPFQQHFCGQYHLCCKFFIIVSILLVHFH
jgi:hypothetical protein